MKRKRDLYSETYRVENIMAAYNEVCRNTKNKRKVNRYKEYKCIYISRIYNLLKNKEYKVGPHIVFTIYEPKERRIVSQGMTDKVVNHLISRYILYPAILPCLLDTNVASRKGLGTNAGLKLYYEYNRICKVKYHTYYILKCDISKYFESINQEILKEKVKRRIKDKDALKIVFDMIDSEEKGLGIGNMTSQILAVFYLNDMDHYIKEVLKIKYYVRYMDDFLLFHPDKKYLQYCLEELRKFLAKEKLTLNRKTRLYKNTNNFVFLGRKKNGRYANYRTVKRKFKKRLYDYRTGRISLKGLVSCAMCYKSLDENYMKKLREEKQKELCQ